MDGQYVRDRRIHPHVLDNIPSIVRENQQIPPVDPSDQGQGQLLDGARRKQERQVGVNGE